MSFQIHALPAIDFAPLFKLSDDELAARNAVRMTVTEYPGTPCRISLEDAQIGEDVILLNHAHLLAASPYAATHAIFVRDGVPQATPEAGAVPVSLSSRLLSVRWFDTNDMMVAADVVDGVDLTTAIEAAFANPSVTYLHLHNAKPGCFAASVTRA
ncbi:MAG: DUF1203 domain-containing protein [Planktomarina sp.]